MFYVSSLKMFQKMFTEKPIDVWTSQTFVIRVKWVLLGTYEKVNFIV